jgi:hypothetical protein
MTVRFPRTYADAEGGSHFDTVEDPLAPTAFVPTNPPMGLSAPHPATAAVFCRLAHAGTAPGTRHRGRSTR